MYTKKMVTIVSVILFSGLTNACEAATTAAPTSQPSFTPTHTIAPPPVATSTTAASLSQTPRIFPSKTQTPTITPLSSATPFPEGYTDLDKAQAVLVNYFSYMAQGQYVQAYAIHGGPEDFYAMLRDWNPRISPDDYPGLLESACTYQLVCLKVKDVVEASQISDTEFTFIVQFENLDGTLFVLGPCCGATEEEMPPVSEFIYTVIKVEGEFKVLDGPVYVP